jgi:hypothetical protein
MLTMQSAGIISLNILLWCFFAAAAKRNPPFRRIRIGYPSVSSRQAQLSAAKNDGGGSKSSGLNFDLDQLL